MRAGQLRHQMVIQSKTESQAASGMPSESWSTHATVWARVKPVKADEGFEAGTTTARRTHEITIRALSTVTPNMRVSWDSRYFYITGVRDMDERGIMMTLDCREEI